MNEFERYVYFENLFNYYKEHKYGIGECQACNLMRVLWGHWNVDTSRFKLSDSLVPLVDAVTPYAVNCARFCNSAIDFMTLCNGLRNAYFDGCKVR